MKATELRIGNYISREDLINGQSRIEEVIEIGRKLISSGPIKVICDYDEIQPIPLAEEWLFKFGFEKRKKLLGLLVFSKSGFDLHFVNGKWEFYVMGSSCILAKIKYVHQLQNLYFALTGEELEIK